MTPLYADRFAGHMPDGDPRTPLHGAAGCVWPTVPATRYLFTSDDATGIFLPFKLLGALVIRSVATVDHDLYSYISMAWAPPWELVYCRKVKDPSTSGYRWQIQMHAGSGLCLVTIDAPFPNQKCNVTVPLGAYECPFSVPPGTTGSTFRMEQVEFDETSPP